MAARQRHLPADLFPEILSRLPVKSLLRFRSVAKPWLALVDDVKFARLHKNTFKNNREETRLFLEHDKIPVVYDVRCSETFQSIPKTLPPWNTDPFAMCYSTISTLDGLILLQSTIKTGEFNSLRLWNPSIRKLLQIPPLLEPGLSSSQFKSEDIGFGYDPVANDYKLVKLLFVRVPRKLHSVAIYSLGDGSWKTIKACSNCQWISWDLKKTVYFRSSLYFISYKVEESDQGWCLVWFDLSKETFSSVMMPNGRDWIDSCWELVSIDGGSKLEVFNVRRSISNIYVWSLDSESLCWTRTHAYCLEANDILHVKKNGHMMMKRFVKNNLYEVYEVWPVTSSNREIKLNKILQLKCIEDLSYMSSYVESLIMHILS